jgi:hypothetical protein
VDVDYAVPEAAFVHQLELHVNIVRESPVAAPDHDGRDQQVELVDQPGLDRLRSEMRAAHGEVPVR